MTRDEFTLALIEHKDWLDGGALLYTPKGKRIQLEYEVIEGGVHDFDLAYIAMNRCIFRNVTFVRCKFPSSRMVSCSFFGCRFEGCFFNNSSFEYSTFYSCEFVECRFSNCSLGNTSIHFTEFTNCLMSMCTFRKSSIRRSGFYTSDFANENKFEFASIECSNLPDKIKRILGQTLVEPIIGYKKTREGVVIKAEIPTGAIVFSINGAKCRTNRAKIVDMNGWAVLHSAFDITFTYELNQEIEILDFDPCYSHECAPGFHFFLNEKDAEEYNV